MSSICENPDEYVYNEKKYSRKELENLCIRILRLCKCYENTNTPQKYYQRSCICIPFTKFENLSSNGCVLIQTSLNERHASLVMGIFQMLWEDSFFFCEWDERNDDEIFKEAGWFLHSDELDDTLSWFVKDVKNVDAPKKGRYGKFPACFTIDEIISLTENVGKP